jgi:GDP-D-mannose 3',5'-epimerase
LLGIKEVKDYRKHGIKDLKNINMQQGKKALVMGAGGFIGSHLVKRLKSEGYWVRGVDLKYPEFSPTEADDFVIADLRNAYEVRKVSTVTYQEPFLKDTPFDEVYQLACLMGGAGFIFTGGNDADIMTSAQININLCRTLVDCGFKGKVFYSSSACMYPQEIQANIPSDRIEHDTHTETNFTCLLSENGAYPANPDSEYGWEKLFSERLFLAYHRNYGLQVRIARFHNIFGPEGTYKGGKEKAPAAICRKVSEAKSEIEVWGDGEQTRSFLYIDECIEGVRRLIESDFTGPVNIGSDEMVSINKMAKMVMGIAGKQLTIKHIPGPTGVRGRNSDNTLIFEKLGWKPSQPLRDGLTKTYHWINKQVNG